MLNKKKILYSLSVILVLGVVASQTLFASGFMSDSQKFFAEVYQGDNANTVPVTKITLNKTTVTMKANDKVKLTAAVAPANATRKSVTWVSNNTNVAKVANDGTVTAVANGTTTIAAVSGSQVAECTVTVSNVASDVTSITLDNKTLTMKVKAVKQLKAVIKPVNAVDKKLVWTSSDAKVATVDANGKVTAKSAGKATITVKTANGNKTATCVVTVKK